MLYDFTKVLPNAEVHGIDVSAYAIENSKEEIRGQIKEGRAESLPWPDDYFDLVYSLNTFHNLHAYELEPALREFERVGKQHKYICVESYRNEQEKANLLYWQVTCEGFNTPEESGVVVQPHRLQRGPFLYLFRVTPCKLKQSSLTGQNHPSNFPPLANQ